jgi:GMP synthase (glutamine-hydrolysing)
MANADGTRQGLQFHPEVVHTPNGNAILENFLKLTKAKREWDATGQVERLVKMVRDTVGPSDHVLMAVSGGVDSTVAALLVKKAIGNRLHAVFIDHGLMRLNEGAEVKAAYDAMGLHDNLLYADEADRFFTALKGLEDPEEKRTAVGHAFIHAFEARAKQINAELQKQRKTNPKTGKLAWLAQGTIYPDRIESANASKTANKIKTHHNLALPKDMTLKVIEPLADFYKDEVRAVGKQLGVPKTILERHPFPGPGLAVRVLGEVTREKADIARCADAIFIETLRKHGQYDKVWQAFAALLNVRSVGVQGDSRTYGHMIALRAVTAIDGMTADWAKLPAEVLEETSMRITNEV